MVFTPPKIFATLAALELEATLAAAGRMPPPSPILQHLKESEVQKWGSPDVHQTGLYNG